MGRTVSSHTHVPSTACLSVLATPASYTPPATTGPCGRLTSMLPRSRRWDQGRLRWERGKDYCVGKREGREIKKKQENKQYDILTFFSPILWSVYECLSFPCSCTDLTTTSGIVFFVGTHSRMPTPSCWPLVWAESCRCVCVCLSSCLSVYLFIFLSVCVCLCLSCVLIHSFAFSLCLCLCWLVCLFVYLSIHLCVSLGVYFCLSVTVCVCLTIYLSVC